METIRPLMFKDLKVGEKFKKNPGAEFVWVKTGEHFAMAGDPDDPQVKPVLVKDSLHVTRVD